jgi:hypothetical protein
MARRATGSRGAKPLLITLVQGRASNLTQGTVLTALSAAHRAALEAVVQACPDDGLAQLEAAVGGLPGDKAGELAILIQAEIRDRARRDQAFAPLIPLFRPRADQVAALTFPRPVLARLWREAKVGDEPYLSLLDGAGPSHGDWTLVADRLCARAAAVLRDRPGDVWADPSPPAPVSNLSPAAAPAPTPAELAGCFDLAPLARTATPRLPAWLDRPDDEQAAGLRLLIQDCLAVSPEGGRRMVDILFAHVADAERMLRVVTRTNRLADKEAMLSHSDMGVFVERLLASVTTRVARIAAARPGPDEAAMAEVVQEVAWCAGVLGEIDLCLQLRPDSPWGRAARMARIQVAGQMSGLMKSASVAVHAALPMKRQRLSGRMTRLSPWLDAPATGEAVEAAAGLLNAVGGLRGAAVVFGCEADRMALKTELTDYLSIWANEALDHLADGQVAQPEGPLRLVGVAARFLTLIDALEAARAVRRRAAAAEALLATQGASPAAA